MEFYADAKLYDRLFPEATPAVEFYRAVARGRVLELGSGTGEKLIPIASDGHPCVGLELSPEMLAEAKRKADERDVAVEWVEGDMRDFQLGEFDVIFSTGNSLLHLHEADDIIRCFRAAQRHLAPGGSFILDVFNPSMKFLAQADGTRRRREDLSFNDPERGRVHVDVEETYDAAAQVTRGTWFFSTDAEPDFRAMPLEIRSIFPQEMLLLLSTAGLRGVERYGDWARSPFTGESSLQIYVCEPD